VNIVPIETVLLAHPMKLRHPELNVLKASEALYTVLALQPEGRIRITESSIGHADAAEAGIRIREFFKLLTRIDATPDLVVAPEYSIPWETLLSQIEAGNVPSRGKLWVLGCESLPVGQLKDHANRLKDKVVVIDEGDTGTAITTQRYPNPLVYLFTTHSDETDSDHVVMLVQYKTETSGDAENIEIRGMLPGKTVYLFGRLPHEVRLMTLICSDVFGLSEAQITEYYDGLLVLHIQLNNNPRHPIYKQYRAKLFACGDRTELFCLNWAQGVVCVSPDGKADIKWPNIGGSAWYLRPRQFNFTDERISANHKHGVYYTRHEPIRVHAMQFHYAPRIFHLEATKVFHHGVIAPKSHLTGPRALGTFGWSAEKTNWTQEEKPEEQPLDGFTNLLAAVGKVVNLEDLATIYNRGPVDVERVLAISAGHFGPRANWYDAPNVDSMQLCQEEIIHRVTVTIDPDGATFRSQRISAATVIAELQASGHSWPMQVAFLNNGFKLQWSNAVPHRNVQSQDGTYATVIYAGQVGDPNQLARIDQLARQTISGHIPEPPKELSEEEARAYRHKHYSQVERLCVLYSLGATIKAYADSPRAAITSPAGVSPVDIGFPAARRAGQDF
jgi:hypothetical protein